MLRRLFGGRKRDNRPAAGDLRAADPAARRQAVLALDEPQAAARMGTLATMLAEDPDRSVRLAVLERMTDVAMLARYLDDDAIAEATATRIGVITAGQDRALPDHPRLATLRLQRAPAADRAVAIAAVADIDQLITLALKDRGALRIAVLAHPMLQSAAGLARLEKRSRGADKALNRHARTGLDRVRQLEQRADAAAARIAELVSAQQRDTLPEGRVAWERAHALHARTIAALADYDAACEELAQHGETRPDLAELRARLVVPPPEPPPPAVIEPNLAESQARDINAVEAVAPVLSAASNNRASSELSASDTNGHAAEMTASGQTSAPTVAAARNRGSALADSIPAFEEASATPVDPDPVTMPDLAEDQPASSTVAPTLSAADQAARDAALGRAEQAIAAGEAALEAGQSKSAWQHLGNARRALEGQDPVPRTLQRRGNRLAAALADLQDWQTFATSPKRTSLCESLQALVDNPLAPADQAARLKELRQEWQALGPARRRADAQLAERFEQLAEQAFEPCRAYFAEQAEIRQQNMAARADICSQLQQYLETTDWSQADMKAAERILRTARESWRQRLPVERNADARSLETRFEGLQQALHRRLTDFWTRNEHAKQQLVTDATALISATTPLPERLDQARALQQQWRTIGPAVPRERDQALWTAFRAACDALFAARENERIAADTARQSLIDSIRETLAAMELELASLSPAGASPAYARTLRERLAAIDELPGAIRQPLDARRRSLLEHHDRLLAAQVRDQQRAQLEELAASDAAFSRAERAALEGGPLPEAPAPCFTARLAHRDQPVPAAALRRLTLLAEQIAGIAPPAGDEALRLEVQVERLRSGLGGTADEHPVQLAEQWCALGPKDADVDALRERFFAALLKRT